MRTLLVTGAAGLVGAPVAAGLGAEWRIRSFDIRPTEHLDGVAEPMVGDLTDREAVMEAVRGADAIVHLGGIADEAPYPHLLAANVLGTYHVLEAARRFGTPRIVVASTNRVTGLYPASVEVGPEMPVRPDSFYAASKAAVEALCRYCSDRFGLSIVCLRIGSFVDGPPQDRRHLRTWLSTGDLIRLVRSALEHPDVSYAVVYGVSANSRSRWRHGGEAIGFEPLDDAEDVAVDSGALAERDPIHGQYRDHPEE